MRNSDTGEEPSQSELLEGDRIDGVEQREAVLLDKLSVLLSDDFVGVYPKFLEDIFEEHKMKVLDTGGSGLDYGKIFLTLLDRALNLSNSRDKVSQIELFSKIYPYVGSTTVHNLDELVPKLITNLISPDKAVKRSTLHALHVCIKHSANRVEILKSLAQHGIDLADTKTRTEVMISLPVLITPDVAKEDLFDIVLVLVRRLGKGSVKNEHNPPSLLCLQRLRDVLGDSFNGYIHRLPKQLQMEYKNATASRKPQLPASPAKSDFVGNVSLTSDGEASSDGNMVQTYLKAGGLDKELYFGFIPHEIMTGLSEASNWRSRGLAMENLAALIQNLEEISPILTYFEDFLAMIISFFDDSNFKIQMLSLEIVSDVVSKVGNRVRPYLKTVMSGLLRKLGDGKTVVKQAVNRVILKLMQSVGLSPTLNFIYPRVTHRNSKVRQDAIDIIIIALLTFPRSEFDLNLLATTIAPLLLDNKRKIRQGVLECYSLLAQALGQGKLNPIVTAVDEIELRPGGDGVMDAVQARLARRQLPKLNSDGLVDYALLIPPVSSQGKSQALDVEWVLKAASSGSDSSSKSQSSDGCNSKRYFSAGKRRLPWEVASEVEMEPRKAVGSAPLRPKPPVTGDDNGQAGPFQDSWVAGDVDCKSLDRPPDPSYLGRYVLKSKIPGLLLEKPELNRSESQGSYFKMYKNRMKRLKQAGLQADQNVMSTFPGSGPQGGGYSLLYKKGTINGRNKSSAEPELPTKVGSQSLSPIRPPSLSPDNVDDQRLSSSWSGPDMSEQLTASKEKSVNDTQISSPAPNQRTVESPVCVKPQLARSASKKRRQGIADKANAEKDEDAVSQKSVISTENALADKGPAEKVYSSPFDSRPRLVRTPSGKLSAGKWKSLDRLTPIEGGQRLQISDKPGPKSPDVNNHRSLSLQRSVSAVSVADSNKPNNDTPSRSENVQPAELRSKFTGRKSSLVFVDSNNNDKSGNYVERGISNDESDTTPFPDELLGQPTLRKSSSGLSKSALERAEKKRLEEKMKWELEQQIREEKRLDVERKKKQRGKSLEHKRQDMEKSLEEIRKLESLLLAKQQEEEVIETDRARKEEKALVEEKQEMEEAKRKREEEQRRLDEEKARLEGEKRRLEQERKKDELRKLERRALERKEEEEELRIVAQNSELNNSEENSSATRKSSQVRDTLQESLTSTGANQQRKAAYGTSNDDDQNQKMMVRIKRYESFDIDVSDLTNHDADASSKASAQTRMRKGSKNSSINRPAVSNSPRPRRKNTDSPSSRVKSDVNNHAVSSAGSRSCADIDVSYEQLTALSNPDNGLREALKQLGANSEDWDLKCTGLHTIRCLAAHHPETLLEQLHIVAIAVATEVKNLRSQVTRTSLVCLTDMFVGLGRTMEPETEELTRILLSKTADTNVFIRQDAEKALNAMIQSVSPKHAMMALISGGASHKSKEVRKVCARLLSQVAEKIGSARLLNGTKDITDRIVPTASQLALDGQPETRYYGRKLLYIMMEHQEFEKLLDKHVIAKNLRPVKDLVQTLRNKGLGDPPNAVGSAGVRKSFRVSENSASAGRREAAVLERNSEISQGDSLRRGSGNAQAVRNSSHKGVRRRSRDDSIQINSQVRPIDMDALEKLTSSVWKERMEGIDSFCEVTTTNPEGVANSIVKIFDRFAPRLTDSNNKVLLYAVQILGHVIPVLRDGLIPVINLTVQNLQSSIASKNEQIYISAANALDALVKYVDSVAVMQPLLSAIQFGNSRVKPEMASRLADIVPNLFTRKPHLIGKNILPMFWNLLNTASAGSAGAGRNDLNSATSKLSNQIYLCIGESLVDEAASQGSRVKQRLLYFLGSR